MVNLRYAAMAGAVVGVLGVGSLIPSHHNKPKPVTIAKPVASASPSPSATPSPSASSVVKTAPVVKKHVTLAPAKQPLPVVTPGSTPEVVTPTPSATPTPTPTPSPTPMGEPGPKYVPTDRDTCPKDQTLGILCWHVDVTPNVKDPKLYDYSCFYAFTDGTWQEVVAKTSDSPIEALTCMD